MSEQGPFDRIVESSATHDRSASVILIGLGVLGLLLLVLVLPPLSLLSGGSDGEPTGSAGGDPAGDSALPRVPAGFQALSILMKPAESEGVEGTEGPYALELSLVAPVSDSRNLGLYTNRDGTWERLAGAQLVENGTAVRGQVDRLPANVAVLRRTSAAVRINGLLPAGSDLEPAASEVVRIINPTGLSPSADGGVNGSAADVSPAGTSIMPMVRAASQADIDAVNAILASPALTEAHVVSLGQVALAAGNTGVDIDYADVALARRADFTAFVATLAERLHQSSRSLSLTLPMPIRKGSASWDTEAYDWEEIVRTADFVKLTPEPDPSLYFAAMEEVLAFLKPKVDLGKVSLVLSRQSHEKRSDGLGRLSLHEGLAIASEVEVRTTSRIVPQVKVSIVGRNILQGEGATGLRWDEEAHAVAFAYPGRGGLRTVWLENSLSLAFKLDLADRFGLGGVAFDDVSADSEAPDFWDLVTAYAETGRVALVRPNGPLLRPVWLSQAGELAINPADEQGAVIWTAPAQAGVYDVSLIVSDGVIRATQKLILEVNEGETTLPALAPLSP